jgi:hypothetical protein
MGKHSPGKIERQDAMNKKMSKTCTAAALVLGLTGFLAQAQTFAGSRPAWSESKAEAVQYLFPEQVTLPAGKVSTVALHFRIAQGLHINSHTPSDEFLIPTTFSIPEGAGVRLEQASYPAGTNITLPSDPKTKLNVYSGEFIVQARLVAKAGDHLVQARLHYQACNQNACMPPKTITVPIDVIGK